LSLGNVNISQPGLLSATVTATNVTCFSANDGTITISSPSGATSYQYSINGGGTWVSTNSFTGLANSTYDVRIRDAVTTSNKVDLDGSTNTVISQPAVLNAALSTSNVSCSTTNDGQIIISAPSGGYGTYNFTIDGGSHWQSSGSFTALSGGTYDVRIQDAAHASCIIDLDGTTNTTIAQPSALGATSVPTNVTCSNASNGTITITSPHGGYGTYQYSINGGTTWQTSGSFSNLANNTYNVMIRDAANSSCTADLDGTGNTIITIPAVLSATITPTNVTCNGANDGIITLSSLAGGSGSFQFSDDGGNTWQTSPTFSSLANGSYNILIGDSSSPTCFVDLDGSANTSITQPSTLSAVLSSTNITCNGANDGKINLSSPIGGYGTYGFSIDGGTSWSSSVSFTSLAVNTYNVLIRDAAHTSCIIDLDGTVNTPITQPAALSAVVTITNVSCNGSNNGIISVTSPTGGYGTYEFSDNGGGVWQSLGSFTSLANGPYDVRIRDAANTSCSVDLDGTTNTTITQPNALSATVVSTNVTSFGANDGTITVTNLAGGSGSYEFTINGGTNWGSSPTFTNLSGGTYNVQMRDALATSCAIDLDGTTNTSVQQPTAPLSATLSSTNITCNGSNNGTITISSPAGGYGTYQYSIDGGAHWSTSGSFTGLSSGTYNTEIRDASYPSDVLDLDGTVNTSIGQPNSLSASVASTNVSCLGSTDGSIIISSPTGGSGGYQFTVNGGTSWSSLTSFTNLSTGNYNVEMRDSANPGCVVDLDGNSSSTAITQPAALSASVAVTNVTSPGANDGSITISSPSGGYGTYQYSIDGGITWQYSGSFTGLANGSYHVVMRDAAHTSCSVSLDGAVGSTTVNQPSPLSATVSSSNVSCNGTRDGQINITHPSGGYGTYEYSVDGGVTWSSSGSFTGLSSGTYAVMIRDAAYPNNVVDLDGSTNTIITQPSALSATISSTNLTSVGVNDGTISISSAAGGYGTYQYSINGGTSWQNSGSFTSLASGTYSVAIRDAAHVTCVIDLDGSTNTVILPPLSISVTSFSNINCFGRTNGSLTVSGYAGVPPYTYSIDGITFSSANTFTDLAPNNYTLWVKDSSGSTASTTASVGQPNAPLSALAASQKNAQCFGTNSGSITAQGVNGTEPYTYSTDGATFVINNLFSSLGAGVYTITVQDANGCFATTTTTIGQPDQISASAIAVSINGDDNGSLYSLANGGTQPYTYSWSGPDGFVAATDTIRNLLPGVYSVTVTDSNNCISGLASYTITFKIYEGISPNGDGKNDYWRIDGIEGYPNNLVRIFDRFSNMVFETNGYTNESNNWYGQSNHGLVRGALPDGTYYYTVSLGDGSGTKSGYVILKRH
jgi:gliding motility-associated-like protein